MIPFEMTKLIHSFLPNTKDLFAEQRMRFLNLYWYEGVFDQWDFDEIEDRVIFYKTTDYEISMNTENLSVMCGQTKCAEVKFDDEICESNICKYLLKLDEAFKQTDIAKQISLLDIKEINFHRWGTLRSDRTLMFFKTPNVSSIDQFLSVGT